MFITSGYGSVPLDVNLTIVPLFMYCELLGVIRLLYALAYAGVLIA